MSNPEDFVINNGVLKKYNGFDKDIVIPEEVTELEWDAFKGCSSLTSIQIPEGVTKIGSDTFSGCTNLTSIRIPESVTEMNESAFAGCSSLKSIHVQEANRIFKEIDGIVYNHNITTLLICPNARDKDLVIPDTVTRIGRWSFRDCTNLTRITLPESITTIENSAFFDCTSLTTINIPEGVTEIGGSAFTGCSALQEIILPYGLTQVSNSVFSGCSQIKSIFIPESVKEIQAFAFGNCTSLEKIVFSNNVTIIGAFAFDGCTMLREVILPDSVTTLEDYAFSGCLGLKRVFIPDSVCKIERETFNECRFLKYLRLPRNAAIDRGTFSALNHLQVDCNFNIREKLSLAYSECLPFTKLNAETISYLLFYQTAAGWWSPISNAIEHEQIDRTEIINALAERVSEGSKLGKVFEKRVCDFITAYSGNLTDVSVKKLMDQILIKNQKMYQRMISLPEISEKLHEDTFAKEKTYHAVEQITQDHFIMTAEMVPLKSYLTEGVPYADHSGLCTKDAILLILSECLSITQNGAYNWTYSFSEFTEQIIKGLDRKELMECMKNLIASEKCISAALVLGKYGDEASIEYLIKKIEEWTPHRKAKIARRNLEIVQNAIFQSNTIAAASYFSESRFLEEYAYTHSTERHTTWFQHILDYGFNEKGQKSIDLGYTFRLTVHPDLSYTLYSPLLKEEVNKIPSAIMKAAPLRKANTEFERIKKRISRDIEIGKNMLFNEFLSGEIISPEIWKNRYSGYLQQMLVKNLIWEQDGITFIISGSCFMDQNGNPYAMKPDYPVRLSHPFDLTEEALKKWKKYFVTNKLKQPFPQLWEPIMQFEDLSADRYRNYPMEFSELCDQEHHGIYITYETNNDEDYTILSFEDCTSDTKEVDCDYIINSIQPKSPSRFSNHVLAYLDRLTIKQRILKDDLTVSETLSSYTMTQITDFLNLAAENNCPNVTALLLNYKNEHFSDFDPMEEFALGEL